MTKESPELRSRIMASVHSKNTKPEIFVRSLLHRMGFRYRLHRKDLPGKPDIVMAKYSVIINVNGCFWHMHNCKHGKVKPQTNSDYWQKKRVGNRNRDRLNRASLRKIGWRVLDVWECEIKNPPKLEKKLKTFIEDMPQSNSKK